MVRTAVSGLLSIGWAAEILRNQTLSSGRMLKAVGGIFALGSVMLDSPHWLSPLVGLSLRKWPSPLRLVGVATKRSCGASASLACVARAFSGLWLFVVFILLVC